MTIRILPTAQTFRIDNRDCVLASTKVNLKPTVRFVHSALKHLGVAKEQVTARLRLTQFEIVNTIADLGRHASAVDLHGQLLLATVDHRLELQDRKSTRLNSSHLVLSYAVSSLK